MVMLLPSKWRNISGHDPWEVPMRYLMLLLAVLLTIVPLCAQGGPGMMFMGQGTGSSTTLTVNTTHGLFVLRSGVLAKYAMDPLKQVQVLQLFGSTPEMPTDMTDSAAMQKYMAALQRRQAPAIMLVKNNALLVVIGNGFARINQETLQIEVQTDLAATPPANEAPGASRAADTAVSGYLLVENTLYLPRNTELLAVSVTDGKVLSRLALPQEMQPAPMMLMGGPGGARPGMGGNGGGNMGGNDPQGMPAPPQN
jgi:hypothetical protein